MYQFIIRYCLFFIVYCLIYHTARVASDLTVFDDKKPITFSTLDYFAYNRSYYTHAGQAISWTWANNTSNCTLGPLDENLKKIANDSSADLESNFAIVTSINDAKQAGCTTIREIGHAVEEISKQLTSRRQPKVDLLIVTVITASPTLYWGPGSYGYYSAKSPGRVENPPPIDIALLDQNVSREFYKLDQLKKGSFRYKATQEDGPWNNYFRSKSSWGCGIGFGALILVFLLYTSIRAVRAHLLGQIPTGFPRYIFVLAVLYSIALATQLSSLASFMQEDAAYCAMQYFSILLPLLLFVYWLNKVRVLLHRMVYIVLMSLVALNMCVILVVLVASVTLLYTVKYTIDMDAGYYYWKGIMYICILSCGSALSLSVFILGRKSYMSKDDRYAQFSFLGAAVIAVFIFLAVLFSSVTGITRVFVNSFTTDDSIQYIYMIYNIRCVVMASIAIISVFVLGVDWPRKVHTRTRGKTILYDMNADNPQAISPLHMPHNMRMSGPRPVLVNMALPNAAHFANANDAAMPGVLVYANQYSGSPAHDHQAIVGSVTPPSAAYFIQNNMVSADGSISYSNDYFGPILPDIVRVQSPVSESIHEERPNGNKVAPESGPQEENKHS